MTQDHLNLTIEGLGFGGEGYARVEREDLRFVSVPHTLPGDRVAVRVGQSRRGRAWAEIERWIERSEAHVDPRCEAYDQCTGCALRHMSLEAERAWKRDAVIEILGRYGPPGAAEVPVEVVCAGEREGHRSRARFTVSVSDEGEVSLGLRSTALDGRIVDVRRCPAQSKRSRGLMTAVAEILDRHPDAARDIASVEIKTGAPDSASIDLAFVSMSRTGRLMDELSALARDQGANLSGVFHEERTDFVGDGTLRLDHRIGQSDRFARVEITQESWIHATPRASEVLLDWVAERFQEGGHVFSLDLCSGTGTATFRIEPLFEGLLAVDEDAEALRALDDAARQAGLSHIKTRAGRVGAILRKLPRELAGDDKPTAALINPMRSPLGKKQLAFLPIVGIRQIVYLGPSAVSAAKDAAVLAALGFEMTRAAAINLHPATGQTMLAFECWRDG